MRQRLPRMTDVALLPWVGSTYGADDDFGSRRILVLGESHYEWCERCRAESRRRGPDLTHYCVAERIALLDAWPDGLQQHWLKIENAFLGRQATSNERREFWQGVAYYNFLQEVVGFGPRIPVKGESVWLRAATPFRTVIEALRPHFVAVAGVRVWRALPRPDAVLPTVQADGKSIERRSYRLASGATTVAGGIAHPSRGLGATWRQALLQALAGVGVEQPAR